MTNLASFSLETLFEVYLNLDYEAIIVNCRSAARGEESMIGLTLICQDLTFWIRKAERDYSVSREQFVNPRIIEKTLVPVVETGDQGRRRYLQILTRESISYGSEHFVTLTECLRRSVLVNNPDLLNYFVELAGEPLIRSHLIVLSQAAQESGHSAIIEPYLPFAIDVVDATFSQTILYDDLQKILTDFYLDPFNHPIPDKYKDNRNLYLIAITGSLPRLTIFARCELVNDLLDIGMTVFITNYEKKKLIRETSDLAIKAWLSNP